MFIIIDHEQSFRREHFMTCVFGGVIGVVVVVGGGTISCDTKIYSIRVYH